MKFLIFSKKSILLVIMTLSFILSKTNIKNKVKKSHIRKSHNHNHHKKINVIGETYTNLADDPGSFAVSDASARVPLNENDPIFENFYQPQMVGHLSEEVKRPTAGPLEAINEIPSTNDYYDGSLNLNKVKIKCSIYTSAANCIKSSGCGWCGSTSSCMFGTSFGPTQPCVKSTWIAGISTPNYIPQIRRINEPVGGVSSTVISGYQ